MDCNGERVEREREEWNRNECNVSMGESTNKSEENE